MAFERSRVEINLDNFAYNIKQLKKTLPSNTHFMQVVKADAYGHGAIEIAKKSLQLGAVSLGVANFEEGALLRYQNIQAPILILSPSFVDEIRMILEYKLTPTISTYEFAEKFNCIVAKHGSDEKKRGPHFQPKIKVHIEVDTGMGRSGFHYKEAVANIKRIRNLSNIEIEGIFSHYSNSENDYEFTLLQNRRFDEICQSLDFPVKYLHIANSAGTVFQNSIKYNLANTNLSRLGLLSYGIYPHDSFREKIDLLPVMNFKSIVCRIKKVYKGDSVGYNRSFIASKDTIYAIVPIGYADGYDFLLSNKGEVLINDKLCQIIGRISMDMITVDITDYPDIKIGDGVTLINDGALKAENIVKRYNGLSYELLAQIGRRAKRYYRENGRIISASPLARREFVSHDFTDNKLNLVIESAINQRLQSKEIASLLYSEILKRFFADKDRDVHYRKNFRHKVVYKTLPDNYSISTKNNNTVLNQNQNELLTAKYFEVETTLSFEKILQQDYFYVACATRNKDLEKYFKRRDVEYRWFLDSNFSLTEDFFQVTKVSIDNLELQVTCNRNLPESGKTPGLTSDMIEEDASNEIGKNCLEIKCTHPKLKDLVGKEVKFFISTKTYYPRNSCQLPIYITELTKGVKIEFQYPEKLFTKIDVVAIFSGQNKYPQINKNHTNIVTVESEPGEWIFPNSGIVFTYF